MKTNLEQFTGQMVLFEELENAHNEFCHGIVDAAFKNKIWLPGLGVAEYEERKVWKIVKSVFSCIKRVVIKK